MKNSQSGFTLIELLVSMAVLISVGVIIGAILYTSLRGTAKTGVVIQVTRNGNFVIAQTVKTIRNAQSFEGVSTDGVTYATNCFTDITTPPGEPTPTPAPRIDYKSIRIVSPDEGIVTFTCSDTVDGTSTISKKIGAGQAFSLLDTSAVSLVDCSFTCSQKSASEVPTITIKFSLKQYQPNALSENAAAASFESSVSMRNTSR